MTLKDILNRLGIDKQPIQNENGSWSIELEDSNEYSRCYTKLDNADRDGWLEQDDEASQVSIETSSIQYIVDNEAKEGDDFVITLLANFEVEPEEYKLIIRELNP